MKFRLTAFAVAVLSVIAWTLAITSAHAPALPQASALPLVQPGQLVWDGAFRVPSSGSQPNTFGYGGWALGYDAARNSLYMVGHDYGQLVAEISIPVASKSTTISGLPTATMVQPFGDVMEGRKTLLAGDTRIGGLIVENGRLIISGYSWFDAASPPAAHGSHFTHSTTTTQTGTVTGPHVLGPLGAGHYGGYMADIPTEWQGPLGGLALTGQCCISIMGRTSFGPSAHVFDPGQLGVATEPIPTTPLMYYPENPVPHKVPNGDWDSSYTNFFNLSTQMGGMFIPSGTRSLLYVGRQGLGKKCYRCSDPDPYCGDSMQAPPYQIQVWAYDLDDLAAVKAGSKQPWDPRPYAIWPLTSNLNPTIPHWNTGPAGACLYIKGFAADPATGRVWVVSFHPDGDFPVIHQFHIDTTITAPPIDCRVDVAPQAGATLRDTGDSQTFTLTATNAVCQWKAKVQSNATTWLSVSSTGGTGSGAVTVTAQANTTGTTRTAQVFMGSRTVAITQGAGVLNCTYVLSATALTLGAAGGSGAVVVTPSDPACTWSTSSAYTWLTVATSGGTATVTAAPNPASLTRTGTVTIAGQTVTVTQAGTPTTTCTYTVSPASLSFIAGGEGKAVTVTPSASTCTGWTVTTSQPWLTHSENGNIVTLTAAANTSTASRAASATVAGSTVSITQAAASAPPPTTSAYSVGFSKVIGGIGIDVVQGVTRAPTGEAYVVGAMGAAFGGCPAVGGSSAAFLMKLSTTGQVAWVHCSDSPSRDYFHTAAVDQQGITVVASGVTYEDAGGLQPTTGAYHTPSRAVSSVFVEKVSVADGSLIWRAILSGSSGMNDRTSLAFDAAGNILVSGATKSTDFPTTPGAYQTAIRGGEDGFIAKLSADGKTLLASTLFGGSADDVLISGVKVHSDGTIYAGGRTMSANIPATTGSFQPLYGGASNTFEGDGLVVHFNAALTSVLWATYLGGSASDTISENHGYTIDAAGRSIIAGHTASTNMPVTATAYQRTLRGVGDTYAAVLSADGKSLVALSLLGGSAQDLESGVALDGSGNLVLTGETESADFPQVGGLKATWQATEMTVSVLSPDLSHLLFSTIYGGSLSDRSRGVAVAGSNIVFAGDGYSRDIPTTDGSVNHGDRDLIVVSLNPVTVTPVPCTFTVAPLTGSVPAVGGSLAVAVTAASGCAWTASSAALTVSPASGVGSALVTVTAPAYTAPTPRTLTATVALQTVTITQDAALCTFTVTPTILSLPVTGGLLTAAIAASDPTCTWTVSNSLSWAAVSPMTGTGSGVATVTAADLSRAGTLVIAGQQIVVRQP